MCRHSRSVENNSSRIETAHTLGNDRCHKHWEYIILPLWCWARGWKGIRLTPWELLRLLHSNSSTVCLFSPPNCSIIYAVHYQDETIMKLLLDIDTDMEVMHSRDFKLLSLACIINDMRIVKLLLENWANPISKYIYRETTPSRATQYGYSDIITQMLEKSNNPEAEGKDGEITIPWVIQLLETSSPFLSFMRLSWFASWS